MRYVNAELDAKIRSIFLIPPRELVEVSSSFVKGLVGPAGWETVLEKYVPPAVYRRFVKRPPTAAHTPAAPDMLSTAIGDELRVRWHRLFRAPQHEQVLRALVTAYTAPDRHYHNLAHVRDCLRTVEAVYPYLVDPRAVDAALFFHDAVYDPTRSDNEERSADL